MPSDQQEFIMWKHSFEIPLHGGNLLLATEGKKVFSFIKKKISLANSEGKIVCKAQKNTREY
jgi:hypothetical protein